MMNEGLYHQDFERDACGIGCIAHVNGSKDHQLVSDALTMLENMEHRGGRGSNPETGDGAGILIQIPHQLLSKATKKLKFTLPDAGTYGLGMLFFPKAKTLKDQCLKIFEKKSQELGFNILGYRQVPVDPLVPGPEASRVAPLILQVFLSHNDNELRDQDLERKLYVLRNAASHTIHQLSPDFESFYIASLSARTVIYKGQLRTDQVRRFFTDLQNPELTSALAIIHSRFSTNTFPNWKLAQPFRYIAHNGEINTIRGNVTKMKSKEALLESTLFTKDELQALLPITNPTNSDSANLDAMVELLVMGGRPLPQVMMMLVPEAWQDNSLMNTNLKAFYKYYASIMEPWDGPAALIFTDGIQVGATLDRNGLRPLRYCITADNRLVMASEAGALEIDEKNIVMKGRTQPGKMLLADLTKGQVIFDEEIKSAICNKKPYLNWIMENRIKLRFMPIPEDYTSLNDLKTLRQRQHLFGFTDEDIKELILPMAQNGAEPLGSMGADTPIAVLSHHSQHPANYFKQLFAQVSNPPIDPIRERLVMSLFTRVGESLNILDETPNHTRQIHLSQPVLFNSDLEKLKRLVSVGFDYAVIQTLFNADGKDGRLEEGLDQICKKAEAAIKKGAKILILSDRGATESLAPIPSLLATGAVHHYLVEKRIRTKAGIVVESGDARETHHFATLIGYGASAVNPYMAFETVHDLCEQGKMGDISRKEAHVLYQNAIGKGLLKILSKMGISTLQSYQSSQIFEAIGLGPAVIGRCFNGTISRIGGLGFDDLAMEVLIRHRKAFPAKGPIDDLLEVGGVYQWKRRGEKHLFNPDSIYLLQHSSRKGDYGLYKKYAQKMNEQVAFTMTLRGLLDFKKRKPIPIEEVEPIEKILKRFSTGAMSFGAISHEAHTTLAIAMNRIGAKSNSGEGGEDEIRFEKKANGDWERSAIKQVASGRFGVTSYYLTNADELQIKIAQGAKPGEGGQLPGHKVDDWIGRVRHSTPGVGLISPPPHHDIYSIEDLAQLIYDLKNANRSADINVKLVSQAGVGTVAAGVAKGKSDAILIAGADGGTGASPLSSIRHAGLPWELGLAEAHQTLVKNNLRSRVRLQVDGQIRTGRDLAIATLLGAEEWGVSTAALVVEGCIMMRKCHLNTCPVGVATQNPELRKLFTGQPDHVVNFFTFLAMDLREIMASLGFRTVNEMVGQSTHLTVRKENLHWKSMKIDLSPVLHQVKTDPHVGLFKQKDQDFELEKALDFQLLEAARPAFDNLENINARFKIRNINRAVGAILSNEISKRFHAQGLPEDTLHYRFTGSAGQSFGAFLAKGIKFEVEGEANDYFGKGCSGGKLIIYPSEKALFRAKNNIIIGNVAFYGATSGQAFIRGMAGERFCVRNSGVQTVVEGVGDHACEYMTGGSVIVLGPTGKNFAAGMSGGVAYVYNPDRNFSSLYNPEMVDLDPLDAEDEQTLKAMISKHARYTGSQTAKKMLNNWSLSLQHFIKIMPRDYKAVLLKQKEKIVA